MKISKKCEYALKALVELAMDHDRGINLTLISDIADRENIPPRYLEHIMLSLKKSGILKSKRGVGGGYSLSRPSRSISLGEVIKTIDGPITSQGSKSCVEELNEGNAVSYCLQSIMNDVGNIMLKAVNSISLQEMTKKTLDSIDYSKNVLNYAI